MYVYTHFLKLTKNRERNNALCYVLHLGFFFSFLLNNTSWHSFLIYPICFISIWFPNIWTCHNVISTLLMAKHLLVTSVGLLAVDKAIQQKERRDPYFIHSLKLLQIQRLFQPGPKHLANTTRKQSISRTRGGGMV